MKYFEEDYALFELDELSRKDKTISTPVPDKYYYSAFEVGQGEDTIEIKFLRKD